MRFKYILTFSTLLLLVSCLSNQEVVTRQDSDLSELAELNTTFQKSIAGQKVEKTITTNGEKETNIIEIDSLFIKNEFAKFSSLDIEKVFLNGEYQKSVSGLKTSYLHQEEVTKGPVKLVIEKNHDGNIVGQYVGYNNSNYLFDSSFDVFVKYHQSTITSYSIDVRQKLIGMDPTSYRIEGKIL